VVSDGVCPGTAPCSETMKPVLILSDFRAHLPRYGRPQEEGMEWLVAAHARAAATAAGDEAVAPALTARMDRLVRRYTCSPEHIGRRRSELGDFMHTDWAAMKIFNLQECPRGRGLEIRNRFFSETADQVVRCLFAEDADAPTDLIHVTCTGYASPSPIQRLIEMKKWNARTRATQVYHTGCYAAVPALRLAAGLLGENGRSNGRAEIIHTELCTLHFNPGDHSPEQLVVQSLFADGHIRYSLSTRSGPGRNDAGFAVLAVHEEIVPGSLDDMTWSLSDWGFRMTLSRDVPGRIAANLERFLCSLFSGAGLRYSEHSADTVFAVHPGGPRILESVQQLLRLSEHQVASSRTVLFERGNMSSATLPHIWMAAASDAGILSGTLLVSLAFGPGLTIAGALFRKC
jgi:predicted naringenin-chalcone synthase